MAACWPSAPLYATLYDERGIGGPFPGREVRTSRLQRLGVRQAGFRALLPFYPGAVERLPVQGHELVVSSSSAFAHGVRPAEEAVHVCYCHTPFRYAWHERDLALREAPRPLRPVLDRVLERVRRWDLEASKRVDHYVANSELVRARIEDCYGRSASVVHPPVEVERFSPAEPEDFFLMVGEVVPHKRMEIALEAARRAGVEVRVVGEGGDRERLEVAYPEARFLGRIPDSELEGLLARARALVVPGVEEFGIAAVEAQAAGRPVLAVDAGGASETVVDGVTGVLVPRGVADELAEAMREVDWERFGREATVENARRFSVASFMERFTAVVRAAAERGRS